MGLVYLMWIPLVIAKTYLIILVPLLGLLSCNSSNAWFSRTTCYFPDSPNVIAPGWICQQVNSSELLTAVGFAEGSAAGASFTKNMALSNARVKITQRLKNQCGVYNVSEAMLINSRLINSQLSPHGGLYVQLGIRPSDLRLDCR